MGDAVSADDSRPSSILSPADLTHLKQLPRNDSPLLSSLREELDLEDVTSSPRLTAAFELLSRSRSRKNGSLKERKSASSLMNRALAEEQRQNNQHLKALVRSAVDRVESEMRRAHDAEERADSAERAARDLAHRLSTTEAHWKNELEVGDEQKRRLQLELQQIRNELATMQEMLRREEERRRTAEESASKAKHALRSYQAREQGKEEGKEISTKLRLIEAKKQGFEEGRQHGYEEGYEEGRDAGYEDGVHSGRKQGLREGRTQGRRQEREKAMEIFNRLMSDEMDNQSVDTRMARTREWAEALGEESEEESERYSPQIGRRGR